MSRNNLHTCKWILTSKNSPINQLFGLTETLWLLDEYPLNFFGHLSAIPFLYLGPDPAPAYAYASLSGLWSSTREQTPCQLHTAQLQTFEACTVDGV